VRFEPGYVGAERQVSEGGAFLLEALCGAASVAEVVASFARAADAPEDEARRTVLDFVREGLSRGMLVPG